MMPSQLIRLSTFGLVFAACSGKLDQARRGDRKVARHFQLAQDKRVILGLAQAARPAQRRGCA
jgi:hypothetical protein